MQVSAPSISELLDSRQPGYSLPAGLYTRDDVFEADMEVFFKNQWINIALECDVPEPGDTYVVDVGKTSLIVLRDDDSQIRVLHNVCRHRGTRILAPGQHMVAKLVCPYHQWTYELSGELLHAPRMGKDFDTSCRGLKTVNFVSVGGLIYVCLGKNPPADIAGLIDAMEDRLAPYDIRNAKIAYQLDIIEDGNWKLTMENNRECYHCAGSHPELCVSFIDFRFDTEYENEEEREIAVAQQDLYNKRTQEWEEAGYSSGVVAQLEHCNTNFRTQRLIIGGAGESQTPDATAASSKLMGTMTRKDLGDVHLWGHNCWNHFMGDHAVTATAIPLSSGKTLVRTKWLVNKDAVEGVDYDLEKLTSVWIATTQQDADLVARSQAGVEDPSYVPGPYSEYTEKELDKFAVWYIDLMKASGY